MAACEDQDTESVRFQPQEVIGTGLMRNRHACGRRLGIEFGRSREAGAAAVRRDLEIEGCVGWKATLLDQVLGRFVLGADLNQLLRGSMCLTEMCAEAAVSLMNLKHGWRPFLDDRCD